MSVALSDRVRFAVDQQAWAEGSPSRDAVVAVFSFLRGENAVVTPQVATVFGMGLQQDDALFGAVVDAWRSLTESSLISPQEMASAIRSGTLPRVFLQAAQAGAQGGEPLWPKIAALQLITENIAKLEELLKSPDVTAMSWCIDTNALIDPFVESQQHKTVLAMKDAGNVHFISKRYGDAIAEYDKAVLELGKYPPKALWSLASVVFSNKAQSHIFLEQWAAARRAAARALVFDATNEKAQHRKIRAEEGLSSQLGGIEKEARKAALKDTCAMQ